jgi:TPR repeat protein
MKSHKGMLRFSRIRKFLVVGSLAAALGHAGSAWSQESAGPASPSCVPSDLAALIAPEGQGVRVLPEPEVSRGQKGRAQSSRDTLSREARQAYKAFERDARKGSAAAQVNLAAAFLAGWGTQPNAGAALYWLNMAAQQGFGVAFYDLGILYFKGCGVRQDYDEAFSYFQQGANAGDAPSQVNLGYMYSRGLGVTRDAAAAAAWHRKAAEAGNPEGQYSLADMYLHGEGVAPDDAAAFSWFQKAAVQGHTGARIMLGSMYAAGRGAQKDLVSAYAWISAAALQGDSRAPALLPAIERRLTPALLAQAKSRARALAEAARRPSQELAQLRQ